MEDEVIITTIMSYPSVDPIHYCCMVSFAKLFLLAQLYTYLQKGCFCSILSSILIQVMYRGFYVSWTFLFNKLLCYIKKNLGYIAWEDLLFRESMDLWENKNGASMLACNWRPNTIRSIIRSSRRLVVSYLTIILMSTNF